MGKKNKSKTASSRSVNQASATPSAERKLPATFTSQGLSSGARHVPAEQGTQHLKPGSPSTIKVAPDPNIRSTPVSHGFLLQQGSPHLRPGSPATIRSAPDPSTPF